MKLITTSIVVSILLMASSVNAQKKGSFIINRVDNKYYITNKSIITSPDNTTSYDTIEIKFDQSLGNFNFGVYSVNLKDTVFANKKFGQNDGQILPDLDGWSKITIFKNHKIRECPEIRKEVPDNFTVKVNDVNFGPFMLSPGKGSFIVKKVGDNYKLTDANNPNNSDNTKPYDTIEIKFDVSLRDFNVGVYSSNLTDAVFENKKFGRNGEDIPYSNDGDYKITIFNNHKIYGLSNIRKEVSDTFMIKVNDLPIGPFLLSKGKTSKPKEKSSYKTGFILYDAIYLTANRNNKAKFDTIRLILKNYDIYDTNDLNNNPFLDKMFPGLYDIVFYGVQGEDILGKASLLSSLGGLDVTNLVDGLAKFMVERGKEELNTAFFEKFKEEMGKKEYADLQTLFPETYSLLLTINTEIYKYNIYLSALREAFKHDLSNLFIKLQVVLKSENHLQYFDDHKELKAILLTSLSIIDDLTKKKHPGEILANLPMTDIEAIGNKDISGSLKTIQLLSTSLRSKSKDYYWVPIDSVKFLFDDPIALKIYLGLIYGTAKIQNIDFGNNITLTGILKIIAPHLDEIDTYKLFVESFVERTSLLTEYLKEIQTTDRKDLNYNDYYRYFNTFLDVVEMVDQFQHLPHINLKTGNFFGTYLFIARRVSDVYLNVNQTNYGSAIANTVSILDTLFATNFKNQIANLDELEKSAKSLKSKIKPGKDFPVPDYTYFNSLLTDKEISKQLKDNINWIGALKKTNDTTKSYDKKDFKTKFDEIQLVIDNKRSQLKNFNRTKQLFFKYGTFMAGVASAKNSDEVKAVIESTVLPAGSSIIKTYSTFNFSINSYLGGFVGHEWIHQAQNAMLSNKFINTAGVAAPIGLSFSFGTKWKGIGAVSIFGSIIDIGAVASFRLQNDSANTVPTIKLENILAPGGYLVLNRLINTPLSLGFGYQFAPQLRKVTIDKNEITKNISRFNIFLAVDIPFFNIYTKPKN